MVLSLTSWEYGVAMPGGLFRTLSDTQVRRFSGRPPFVLRVEGVPPLDKNKQSVK